MSFAHVPFLPFLQSHSNLPSRDTIAALATITPFLVCSSIADQVLPNLPEQAEFYIYHHPDHASTTLQSIVNLLDRGATKVITDRTSELIQLGVPPQRLITQSDPSDSFLLSHPSSSELMIEIEPEIPFTSLQHIFNNRKNVPTYILYPSGNFQSPFLAQGLDSKFNLVPIIRSSDWVAMDLDQMIDIFLARLKTDRSDGLYSTSVVSTSPSSTLLGQVYSSLESIKLSIKTRKATYFSRSRNQIWLKGEISGSTQELIRIRTDCDRDSLEFRVIQKPSTGFCHTDEISCFGPLGGLMQLESTLVQRLKTSVPGSYTNRLFTDDKLLKSKIMEEAEELCEADSAEQVQGEMADVIYFALCRCISKGVSLADVEKKLNQRSLKVTRRKGDAKPKWQAKINQKSDETTSHTSALDSTYTQPPEDRSESKCAPSVHESSPIPLRCQTIDLSKIPSGEHASLLRRPMTDSKTMNSLVTPIIDMVKENGDKGLMDAVRKFDKCAFGVANDLTLSSPFSIEMMEISEEIKDAIDVAYRNIYKFHSQQLEKEKSPMVVETMKGVVCSRFARPIDRVGLYVPGGTAILPSTALMLAIPAQVAGCPHISIATPPRADGTISPEILYIASKCGVHQILKAGGAHAIAALAYGTETVAKVDKIFGPGNQFVTVAKMIVSSDLLAGTAIDMPAGPSEVLVIADQSCNPTFVAADLLSQAEHGIDSQVVLIAVNLSDGVIDEIELQICAQAKRLSRIKIIQESIAKSFIVKVQSFEQAFQLSNHYAPEHLILHLRNSNQYTALIKNAGSVFIGPYSPESCGDYASGTNHSLPTVGFAKQYSGVSTMSFMKHITAQELSIEGLENLGPTVIKLANLEGLDGHANAVQVRLVDRMRSASGSN